MMEVKGECWSYSVLPYGSRHTNRHRYNKLVQARAAKLGRGTRTRVRVSIVPHELLRATCNDERHLIDVAGHHLLVSLDYHTIPHDNMRDHFRGFCSCAGLKATIEQANCLLARPPVP